MAAELLVLVKHDCEVCDQVLPVLDAAAAAGAPLRILSQSSPEDTAAQARRVGPARRARARRGPRGVGALRSRRRPDRRCCSTAARSAAASRACTARGWPSSPAAPAPSSRSTACPSCARAAPARTRDPDVAATLAARRARAEGRLRARALEVGALEDPFEALYERGLTDGLPVVPPTPERVVAHARAHRAATRRTSSAPCRPTAARPPSRRSRSTRSWRAARARRCRSCWPRWRRRASSRFALHGLLATTLPGRPDGRRVAARCADGGRDERRGQRARPGQPRQR